MSKVYFIKAVNEDIFKVGITRSCIEQRISMIQNGNHLQLELFSTILFDTDELNDAEKAIHARLADCRLRGEWFAISAEEIKKRVEGMGFLFGTDGCKRGYRNIFNAQGKIVGQHNFQDFVWQKI